jgi:hypothetical protein
MYGMTICSAVFKIYALIYTDIWKLINFVGNVPEEIQSLNTRTVAYCLHFVTPLVGAKKNVKAFREVCLAGCPA